MYTMFGNLGLEAHIDNDHTLGISLLCTTGENQGDIGPKKWILFDMKDVSTLEKEGKNFS